MCQKAVYLDREWVAGCWQHHSRMDTQRVVWSVHATMALDYGASLIEIFVDRGTDGTTNTDCNISCGGYHWSKRGGDLKRSGRAASVL